MDKLIAISNPIAPNALNPINPDTGSIGFVNLIRTLVTVGFTIGTLFFVFWFILGGINWITSGGDKNKIESARGTVMNAVIGLVVLFTLIAVLGLIGTVFDIDILQIDLNKIKIDGRITPKE